MLLGLSGDATKQSFDRANVTGSEHGDGGVANGGLLTRYAEAVHSGEQLDSCRAEVIEAVGNDGLVDAAAVCANFNMMVRIADGTGTPLDNGSIDLSEEFRAGMGLEDLTSRRILDSPTTRRQ